MSDSVVVDLAGKPLAAIPEPDRVLAILKKLVAGVESGELKLEWLYVIGAEPDPAAARGHLLRRTWDTGITVAEAVFELEQEKYILLHTMMGESL
jgi:hypothetical protein